MPLSDEQKALQQQIRDAEDQLSAALATISDNPRWPDDVKEQMKAKVRAKWSERMSDLRRKLDRLNVDTRQEGLDETTAEGDDSKQVIQDIIDKVAKEGILGTEAQEKIIGAMREEAEFAQGARNRQLSRSTDAIAQRGGLGPRSGATRNLVLNKALAPSVGGIVQQGAQNAAFRGDLTRANETSKTLLPLEGAKFISNFLQNRFGQQSGRDINLQNLSQNQRQFDANQRFQQNQANQSRGFNPFDLLSFVPGVSQIYNLFKTGKDIGAGQESSQNDYDYKYNS